MFLFIVPPNIELSEWLNFTEEQLLINGNMYWQCLYDAPEPDGKGKTIHFHKVNRLTTKSLKDIVVQISKNEVIRYE